MNQRFLSRLVLCAAWLMSQPTLAVAQSEDGIQAAKRALESTRQPWYDADADGLKSLAVPGQEETNRGDWRGTKRPDWNWKWGNNWALGAGFSWFGEFMKLLAWTVLIVLLAVLVYALVQAFLKIEQSKTANASGLLSEEDQKTDEQRIENLPINLRKKKGDFLDIARGYYEAGDFAEAIVYLFSHRLVQLDRAGCIRLTKGKTNRQYLMELIGQGETGTLPSSAAELQKILGQTMSCFEDVFFGKHSLNRERFEGCWNHNESFQLLVQRVSS